MTVSCLGEGAEAYIQVMHLMLAEEKIVRSVIHNYAWPEGCWQRLCTIIYRVVQAIKSLFGASDWQVAKKVISDRVMNIFLEERLIPAYNQKLARYLYSDYSEDMLKLAVEAQEEKASIYPKLQEALPKLDLINSTRKQIKGYTVIEA